MSQINELIKFPVSFDESDCAIFDANSEWICDVDNPLRDDISEADFNAIGQFIADAINEKQKAALGEKV